MDGWMIGIKIRGNGWINGRGGAASTTNRVCVVRVRVRVIVRRRVVYV
jgi:hypothetical protein